MTERALKDLTNLAKVTDQCDNATALAALVIPGYGGARGAGAAEGALTPRVQAAYDKFLDAKAVREGTSAGKNGGSAVGGPDAEAGMPYNHPVKESPGRAPSGAQGNEGGDSKGGTSGSAGSGVSGKIDEFIPPGMERPFRPVNPPNKAVVDAMDSPKIKSMVGCDGADCSEIAIKPFEAAGSKGRIIVVRPVQSGNLNVYEHGATAPGQFYHQVYTDGRYVYDPRLSSNPIPKGDWEQHIKGINPDGVKISNKLKGLK